MLCNISICLEACSLYSAIYCVSCLCFCSIQVLIGRAWADGTVSQMALVFQSTGRSDNIYLCADSDLIRICDKASGNELIDNLISNVAM